MNITEEKLKKTKDSEEYALIAEHEGKRYIALIDISGLRHAVDNFKDLGYYINDAKKQFEMFILNNKVKPKDRFTFRYWSDGNSIKFSEDTGSMEVKLRISRYSADRFHVEIPKKYIDVFKEGDEVRLIKE